MARSSLGICLFIMSCSFGGFAAVALGAEATRDIRVTGMGTRKCGEWLTWKEEPNGQARAMAVEWARGFMTGHNVYHLSPAGSVINTIGVETPVLLSLMDSYCQRNPEALLVYIMVDVTRGLGGAAVNVAPKTSGSKAPAQHERVFNDS